MIHTLPPQREKPAPPAPKHQVKRSRSHTEVRNNSEKTPYPIRAQEINRSTSQSEDTETKNNGKYGTAMAGTPLPSPAIAISAIDSTSPSNIIEQYNGLETPIPET